MEGDAVFVLDFALLVALIDEELFSCSAE